MLKMLHQHPSALHATAWRPLASVQAPCGAQTGEGFSGGAFAL